MKVINVVFGACFLVNSCSSKQKEYQEYIQVINGINDKVAFDNRCKLTSTYDDQKPHKIDLKIGNPYSDPLLPGKILFEYQKRISKTSLDLNEYSIGDMNNQMLYSLNNTDFSLVTQKVNRSKSLLACFKTGDLKELYNSLDTTVTNHVSLEDFNHQMLEFNMQDSKFSGFQLADSILGIGYKNTQNQIIFIYKWDPRDNILYGVNIE